MGWGRMLLLGNIGQQMDLDDQQDEINSLKRLIERSTTRYEKVSNELERLAAENDELKLYLAAIFRVLVSKHVVSNRELRELIQAIDHEDGQQDNAFHGEVMPPQET